MWTGTNHFGNINTRLILSYRHYFIWLYVFNFPCFSWPVNSKKTVVSFSSQLNTNVQNLMCFVYFVVGKKRSQCHSLLHYYPQISTSKLISYISIQPYYNRLMIFLDMFRNILIPKWNIDVSSRKCMRSTLITQSVKEAMQINSVILCERDLIQR